VLCGARPPAARARRLEAAGARLLPVRRRGEHLSLAAAFERLAREGLTTVLVEGGGRLAAALLREGLVDEVHWFLAPRLLGGDARPALGPLHLRRLEDAVGLEAARVQRLGRDWYVRGFVKPRDRR
jgi:diaminohydroxyphosphoribosylaminopyrimidine deaminase/5-amino-6-(5-phosphoribosylamino)uracil reductase